MQSHLALFCKFSKVKSCHFISDFFVIYALYITALLTIENGPFFPKIFRQNTCGRGAGGTAHVEAIVWVCVEAVRLCRLMTTTDGLVHSVTVAKMETALEVATVICAQTPKNNT